MREHALNCTAHWRSLLDDYRESFFLEDQANQMVVADALYLVSHSAVPDTVTWMPTLTASDTFAVYGKWPADADRSTAVT